MGLKEKLAAEAWKSWEAFHYGFFTSLLHLMAG